MKRELDVVAALIKKDNEYLLSQRKKDDKYGDLWEFPGGKVERGEGKAQATVREIKEELDLDVKVGELIEVFTDESLVLKIKVFLYLCQISSGVPRRRDCQDFGFFTILESRELDLAPVDIKIVDFLVRKQL